MSGIKVARRKIEGLLGDMPAVDAATLVLSQRLTSVETLLPMAALQAHEGDEFVHQLRVASRRADAALRIFEPFLKRQAFAKARQRLKKIRKAAGEARACDVMKHMLLGLRIDAQETGKTERMQALDVLLERAQRQRDAAQIAIHTVARKYPPLKLADRRAKLLAALRTIHLQDNGHDELAMTFRAFASARLEQIARPARLRAATPFQAATRLEELHELRIRAKRVRYAIEIFALCYDDKLKKPCSRIEALQELLGGINDLHDLTHWLTGELQHSASQAREYGTPVLTLEQHASIDALVMELERERDARADAAERELNEGKWSNVFDLDSTRDDCEVEIEARRIGTHAAEVRA